MKDFENFLKLTKGLLLLAESLNTPEKLKGIQYIDLEMIYKNFFDEFMKNDRKPLQ